MKLTDYRDEVLQLLTRVDTKQDGIFHRINKIEYHLEKLNSKVAEHEKAFVVVKTWGAVALVIVPLAINVIIRMII
tara:strand:+ start:463 stop:690 length:228 start_codon:yes stop_codon:yes gene_type:complete